MFNIKNWFIKECDKVYGCYVEDAEKFCSVLEGSPVHGAMLGGMKDAERLCKFSLLNIFRLLTYKSFNRKPSFMKV